MTKGPAWSFLALLCLLPAQSFCVELRTLQESEKPQALHLVFAGLRYPQTRLFLDDLSKIRAKLRLIEPFNALQDFMEISYLEMSPDEESSFFKQTAGMPSVKARVDLLRMISSRVSSYKLIIMDHQGVDSAAELSSIRKTSLLVLGCGKYPREEDLSRAFLHELGHSLGLRDECLRCAKTKPGPPNCAPDKRSAENWWGAFVGKIPNVDFIPGCCGSKDHFRPAIASLMNNPLQASDYGFVSREYLRREFSRLFPKND